MNKQARIIPRSSTTLHADWQQELATGIKSSRELLRRLELPETLAGVDPQPDFPIRVPLSYLRRIEKGNPADPLLRQVLAREEENLPPPPGYGPDPLDELRQMPTPGLLHKYPGRVLFTLTGACAIHCRYCFRRHFPYADANPARDHWQASLDYIRADPGIREVILSGGDPLSLSDGRLNDLLDDLESITHIRRLRFHSRLPVVIPSRVTSQLCARLEQPGSQRVLVLHINHAREIDQAVAAAMAELRATGVTLLNQAVLLQGVNDSPEAQIALGEALFSCGILPYYLHQLDTVQGAAHYAVPEARARSIIQQVREQLPGYLVPTLVEEQPGRRSKTPL